MTKTKRTTVSQVLELNSSKQNEELIKTENDNLDLIYQKTIYDIMTIEPIIMEGILGHINYTSNIPIVADKKAYFELTMKDLSSHFNPNVFFTKKETNNYAIEYYEKLKTKGSFYSNVRFGLIHESKDRLISVGSDDLSYAYRVVDGVLINRGQTVQINDALREGEVLTMCVYIKGNRNSSKKKKKEKEKDNNSSPANRSNKYNGVKKNICYNNYNSGNVNNTGSNHTSIKHIEESESKNESVYYEKYDAKDTKDIDSIYNHNNNNGNNGNDIKLCETCHIEDEDINECESYIRFYINGKEQDYMFINIPRGKYYLIVTLYNKSVVSLNLNQNSLKYNYDEDNNNHVIT